MKQQLKLDKTTQPMQQVTSETCQRLQKSLLAKNILGLFAAFSVIYGNKWISTTMTKENKQLALENWTIGLSGLNQEQIKTGLEKCRLLLEWPPSLAEFRRLALDIPSCIELYQKLKNTEPDARLDQTMLYITDTYNFKTLAAGDHYHQFSQAYNAMLKENLSKV